MPRPIQATIHPEALRHNLARLRAAAPGARLWAVVKANAYGHGIDRVYEGLRGADGFALLDLDEAERVRALGWRGPILLLEGAFEPRDLELCSRLQLWHTVHCDEQIDWLAAHKTHSPQRVFLKLNSGMNRLGFEPRRYRAAYARLSALPQVGEVTHMTHFSQADAALEVCRTWGVDSKNRPQRGQFLPDLQPNSPAIGQEDGEKWAAAVGSQPTIRKSDRLLGIAEQLALFERATDGLPGERSLSNSAATLRHGDQARVRADWVRPGIAAYGGSPDHPTHTASHWDLQPAMSLRARLISVQQVAAGQGIGYGATFTADAPLRVGIVACGYGDGYPRHAPSGTPVLVDGVRTRLLGRVSMDMLAVDLGPVPDAGPGSEVTLWGRSATGPVLPIDEVAQAADTIGYELMCALAQRVPVVVEPDPDQSP